MKAAGLVAALALPLGAAQQSAEAPISEKGGVVASPTALSNVLLPPSTPLLGVEAYATWQGIDTFGSFDLNRPEDFAPSDALTLLSIYGGDFIDGDFSQMIAIDSGSGESIRIDVATNAITTIAPFTSEAGQATTSGMTWDPTSETLYVTTSDFAGQSYLYTVDPDTGAQQTVGPSALAFITAIAADPSDGTIYAIDRDTGSLYTLDPTDGSETLVGPLPFSNAFAQGADFNDATGVFYYAAYNNDVFRPELHIVDPATGDSFLLGAFPVNQVASFAIAATDATPVPPSILVQQTVGTDPASCATDDSVTVLPGTEVYFCYTVINVGPTTLSVHDLSDDLNGSILSGLALDLAPGAWTDTFSEGVAIPFTPTETALNIGTWDADGAVAMDAATVSLLDEGAFPSDPEPDAAIPDNDPGGVTDTLTITDPGRIADLDVMLDISHTWIGDLIVSLQHVETGTTVTFLDRPGRPQPGPGSGCAQNDINALFDDEATLIAEDECPLLAGPYSPNNPLSDFDGELIAGDWILTVSDNAGLDVGTLNSWALEADLLLPEIALALTVGTDPQSCGTDTALTVPAGTAVTYCYTVSNTGDLTLGLHDLVDDQLGALMSAFPADLNPGEEIDQSVLNFLFDAVIDADTTSSATWTAFNAGPVDSASATSNSVTVTVGDAVVTASGSSPASATPAPGATDVPVVVFGLDVPGTSPAVDISGFTVAVDAVATAAAGALSPAALDDQVEQAIAAISVYEDDGSGNPTGPALATTTDVHGGPIALDIADATIDPGASASYVITVDVADSLSGLGAGIALALLAPLALFGLTRRRRLATLLLAGSLALVLAACTQPPPPVNVGFSVQLTAVDATSGDFDLAQTGLPVDGAEVTVTY